MTVDEKLSHDRFVVNLKNHKEWLVSICNLQKHKQAEHESFECVKGFKARTERTKNKTDKAHTTWNANANATAI